MNRILFQNRTGLVVATVTKKSSKTNQKRESLADNLTSNAFVEIKNDPDIQSLRICW